MLGHFYFDIRDNCVLITNDMGRYSFLSHDEFDMFVKEQMPLDDQKWKELEGKFFCYNDSDESFIRRSENAIREMNSYLFEGTSLFIFAVTNICNNRCLYCQANGESEACSMTEEVAREALQMISRSPATSITIEFQGGEPLANFHIIKYIVEEAKKILNKKIIHYTVVSNLSLMTEEIASIFMENQVSVSTSLDGPQYIHDANRPTANGGSSYAEMLMGKAILNRYGIYPGAIETTTALSLEDPNGIVDEYVQNGFTQLFIRPLSRLGAAARRWDKIGYTSDQFVSFYKKTLERIIDYNRKGIKVREYFATLLLSKIIRGRSVNYMDLRSPCGAGLGQMAITANGNIYTCDEGRMIAESGDEAFRIGNVFKSSYDDCIESSNCKAICSASLLDTIPKCCSCVYKPYCGICPVINYGVNNSITIQSKYRCEINKGIIDTLFEYIKKDDSFIMGIFEEWSGCQ